MPHHKKYNSPKLKESKAIQLLTTIWLVPAIAMIIALWLAFQYYSKIGPTIKITFKENVGLIANQSQLKIRNVTVGVVSKISLENDGSGVIVSLKVDKDVAKYLNEKAKFWIVHADVGSHGVSGLDTLLSGSYIELFGVKGEETTYRFEGLEKPYIDKDAKGKYYILSAPNSNNIVEGSHVYYRMLEVGQVERVAIAPDGKQVNFTIFIEEKYTAFINSKSQFYTNSSLSMDFSQGKFDLNIASVSQLVHGGISIYTPIQSLTPNKSQKEKQLYTLYKSLAEMKEKHLVSTDEERVYQFNFYEKHHKLEIGSPVKFGGFKVGQVTDIENYFDLKSKQIKSTVFATLQTEAFLQQDKNKSHGLIDKLVHDGLCATLDSELPMIGNDYINLIFDKKSSKKIVKTKNYDIFPTIKKKKSKNLLADVQKLVHKLQKLPLEKLLISADNLLKKSNKPIQNLLKDLRTTVNSVNFIVEDFDQTVNNLNQLTAQESLQNLPLELSSTLNELTATLQKVQSLSSDYDANSRFASELSLTLRELTLTAESMGRISQKLERKPNALILGDD